MSFTQAISSCLRKYADGAGRASPSEFWYFFLFTLLVAAVAIVLDAALGTPRVNGVGSLEGLSDLACLIPSVAVAIRRLHDVGRTGWWLLIFLVPLLGWLVLLVWCCMKGTDGPNRFGANPLGREALAAA